MIRCVLAAAFVLTPDAALAEEGGLPTGLWRVRIFTPVPTPELKNDEQVFQICYDKTAVKSHMSADAPEKYLSTATKAKRGGHIYIDYLRNGRGNTAVAAYSTRARPGAPVSMPIDWTELNEVSGPAAFTLANVPQRLATRPSDPWRDFFDAAAPLE